MKHKDTSSATGRACAARAGVGSRDVQRMLPGGEFEGAGGSGQVQGCSAGWLRPRGRTAHHLRSGDTLLMTSGQPVLVLHHGHVQVCQAPVCAQPGTGASWSPTKGAPQCKLQVQRPWLGEDSFPPEMEHLCLIQTRSRFCPVPVSPSPVPACACQGCRSEQHCAPQFQLTVGTLSQGTMPLEMGRGCAVKPDQFQAEVAVGNRGAGMHLCTAKLPLLGAADERTRPDEANEQVFIVSGV